MAMPDFSSGLLAGILLIRYTLYAFSLILGITLSSLSSTSSGGA